MIAVLHKAALTLLLAAAPLVADASAQELSLGFGGRHANVGVSVRFGRPVRYESARQWVPGRYETRREQVWVPGCTRQAWTPARYEWRIDGCGRRFQVLIAAGHWRTVSDPGHYEWREVQVWVPGHWRQHGC